VMCQPLRECVSGRPWSVLVHTIFTANQLFYPVRYSSTGYYAEVYGYGPV